MPSISSKQTLSSVKQMLLNVVEKPWGTANNIYDDKNSLDEINSILGYDIQNIAIFNIDINEARKLETKIIVRQIKKNLFVFIYFIITKLF